VRVYALSSGTAQGTVTKLGVFPRQAPKTSQGEKQWLRFFALVGTDIALREKTASVSDTSTNKADLRKELREYAEKLDVEQRLHAFGTAVHATETAPKDAHYFLLRLDPSTKQLSIRGYLFAERDKASADYLETECAIQQSGADAVLVFVESLEALCRAYPNRFLDTDVFLESVKEEIDE
jgi:hypothetical protein